MDMRYVRNCYNNNKTAWEITSINQLSRDNRYAQLDKWSTPYASIT